MKIYLFLGLILFSHTSFAEIGSGIGSINQSSPKLNKNDILGSWCDSYTGELAFKISDEAYEEKLALSEYHVILPSKQGIHGYRSITANKIARAAVISPTKKEDFKIQEGVISMLISVDNEYFIRCVEEYIGS